MKQDDLAHILRAATDLIDHGRIVVIGSQAILATWSEDDLPERATLSMEADLWVLDDPNAEKSDRIEGAIGEGSRFHRTFGYYAQGVDRDTAKLPEGWIDRAIQFTHGDHGDAEAICLDVHDLVASKLYAERAKDIEYARALKEKGLLVESTLRQRVNALDISPAHKRRVMRLINTLWHK